MRERTPSADDTPKRAPPAPPREADVAANKATAGEFYQNFGISSTANFKMVASTNNLEDLGVSHPANVSSEIRQQQQQQQQQQQGHACRSVPTAQDKRSRLSNVINNLRKKVPETKCESSCAKEDDRNSVERNLETLEKYVMTVLNGVIKDQEEKDRESSLEKFADSDTLSDIKDEVKKGDDSEDCENRLEPFVPGSEEANVLPKGTNENQNVESREGKAESLEGLSSSEESPLTTEEETRGEEENEVEKRCRTLGTIIMERLSEHQDLDTFHQSEVEEPLKKGPQNLEEKSPPSMENLELQRVCKELLDDLVNDVLQSVQQSKDLVKVETSKAGHETVLSSPTSLHCSLPLEKVASVLQSCQTPETESQLPVKTKAPSPTVRHLCLYCDRKFSSISLRQRHTERIHQFKGGRRSERNSRKPSHNCQYCSDKGVDNLEGLFQHMVRSHRDKYHACVQCVTRYVSKEALTNHMNDLHNERNCSTQENTKEAAQTKELALPSREKAEIAPKDKKFEEESDFRESALVNTLMNKDLLSNPGSPEFDSSFYSSVSCNIRENLLHHLDGKLQENSTFPNSSTVDVKSQSLYEPNQAQFPIDISLTAATPVYSKDYPLDKLENSSEYAQKPRKNFRAHPRRVSFEKYNFPRKYDGKEQWSCSIKDLSKFDISTQLSLRKKQQLIKERDTLNRLNQMPITSQSETVQTELSESDQSNPSSSRVEESGENTKVGNSEQDLQSCTEGLAKETPESPLSSSTSNPSPSIDFPVEFGSYLRLRKLNKTNQDAEKSDDNYAELTGEWAKPRIYICGACMGKYETLKEMEDHKIATHPNVWCSHYEFSGDQLELYKHLFRPDRNQTTAKTNSTVFPEKICTKCSKNCSSLAELHKHMLECGGDQAWLLGLFGNGKKKCKWRPFGSRSRRRRNRGMKRNIQNSQTPRIYITKEKQPSGPRVRPSDRKKDESIQKMLANLPPKRATRKVLQESAARSQGRLRKIQTNTRSNLVDNSSTRLSRNKAVLRNKLLKNAKSCQRKRCRNDNISAAIETVVNNYVDEKNLEAGNSDKKTNDVSETNQGKNDIKSKIESTRSGKVLRSVTVLSKKQNIKSKRALIRRVQKTRGIKLKATPETSITRRSSKDESNKISDNNSTKGKSQTGKSEQESTEIKSSKKKKNIDPIASLNASIKAKSQMRTVDGKFARGRKISEANQKSQDQSSNGSSRMGKRGKISTVSGRLLRSKFKAAQNLMKDAVKTSRRNSRLSTDKSVTLEDETKEGEKLLNDASIVPSTSKVLRASSRNSSIGRKSESGKEMGKLNGDEEDVDVKNKPEEGKGKRLNKKGKEKESEKEESEIKEIATRGRPRKSLPAKMSEIKDTGVSLRRRSLSLRNKDESDETAVKKDEISCEKSLEVENLEIEKQGEVGKDLEIAKDSEVTKNLEVTGTEVILEDATESKHVSDLNEDQVSPDEKIGTNPDGLEEILIPVENPEVKKNIKKRRVRKIKKSQKSKAKSKVPRGKMISVRIAAKKERTNPMRKSPRTAEKNNLSSGIKEAEKDILQELSGVEKVSSEEKEASVEKEEELVENEKASVENEEELVEKEEASFEREEQLIEKKEATVEKEETSTEAEKADKEEEELTDEKEALTEEETLPKEETSSKDATTKKETSTKKATTKKEASHKKEETTDKNESSNENEETEKEAIREIQDKVILKIPDTSDLMNFDHIHQESCNSNMDSGKENSLEISLNVAKLKVSRQKKTRNARKERTSKRSLNNVIGILTEGVNIPIEAQESVVLTLQTTLEVNPDSAFQNNESRGENNLPESASNLDSSVQNNVKPEVKESGKSEETEKIGEMSENREKIGNREIVISNNDLPVILDKEVIPNKEEIPDKDSIVPNKDQTIVPNQDSSTIPDKDLTIPNDDSSSVPNKNPTTFSNNSPNKDSPTNDIILDLSRRKPKGKGSFLERIVSKIAKKKDVSLESDAGFSLGNVNLDIPSNIVPVLAEIVEKKQEESQSVESEPLGQNEPLVGNESFAVNESQIQNVSNSANEKKEEKSTRKSKKRSLEVSSPKKNKRKIATEVQEETETEKELCFGDIMSLVHKSEVPVEDIPDEQINVEDKEEGKNEVGNARQNTKEKQNTDSPKKSRRKLNSDNQDEVNTSLNENLEVVTESPKTTRKSSRKSQRLDDSESLKIEKPLPEQVSEGNGQVLKLRLQTVYQFSEESDESESPESFKSSRKPSSSLENSKEFDSEMFKVPNTFTGKRSSKRKSLISENLSSTDELSEDSSASESTSLASDETQTRSNRRKYPKRRQANKSESEDDVSTDSSLNTSKENEEVGLGKRQRLGRKAKQNISLVDEFIILPDDEVLMHNESLEENIFNDKIDLEKKRPGRKGKNQVSVDSANLQVNNVSSDISESQDKVSENVPNTLVEKKRPGRKVKKVVSSVSENIQFANVSSENVSVENILSESIQSGNIGSESTASGNVEDVSSENILSEDGSSGKMVTEDTLSENTLSGNILSENTLPENILSEDISSENISSKEISSGIPPTEDISSKDTSSDNTPNIGSIPGEDNSIGNLSSQEIPLESSVETEEKSPSENLSEENSEQVLMEKSQISKPPERKRNGRKSRKNIPEKSLLLGEETQVAEEKKRPGRKSRKSSLGLNNLSSDTSVLEETIEEVSINPKVDSEVQNDSGAELKIQEVPENQDKMVEKKRPRRKAKKIISVDETLVLEQNEISVLGQNETSVLGQNEISVLGQNEISVLGQNEISVLGQNEVSVLQQNEDIPEKETSDSVNVVEELKVTENKAGKKRPGRKTRKEISLAEDDLASSLEISMMEYNKSQELQELEMTEGGNEDKILPIPTKSSGKKRPGRKARGKVPADEVSLNSSEILENPIDQVTEKTSDEVLEEANNQVMEKIDQVTEILNNEQVDYKTNSEKKRPGRKGRKNIAREEFISIESLIAKDDVLIPQDGALIPNDDALISNEDVLIPEDAEKHDVSISKDELISKEDRSSRTRNKTESKSTERKKLGRKAKKNISLVDEHLDLSDELFLQKEEEINSVSLGEINSLNLEEQNLENLKETNSMNLKETLPENLPEINTNNLEEKNLENDAPLERKRPARKSKKNISLIDEHLDLLDDSFQKEEILENTKEVISSEQIIESTSESKSVEISAPLEKKRPGRRSKKIVSEQKDEQEFGKLDSELISTEKDFEEKETASKLESNVTENEEKSEKKKAGRKSRKVTLLLDEHLSLPDDRESNKEENKTQNTTDVSIRDESSERKRPGRKSKKYNSLCEEHLALPDDDEIILRELNKFTETNIEMVEKEKIEETTQAVLENILPQSTERKRTSRKAKKNISLVEEHLELPDDDILEEDLNNVKVNTEIVNESLVSEEKVSEGSKLCESVEKKRSEPLEKKQKTSKRKSKNVSLFDEHLPFVDEQSKQKEDSKMIDKEETGLSENISSTLENLTSVLDKDLNQKTADEDLDKETGDKDLDNNTGDEDPDKKILDEDLEQKTIDKNPNQKTSNDLNLPESPKPQSTENDSDKILPKEIPEELSKETIINQDSQEAKESATDDFQTPKKRLAGNFAVVHTKTGEILIVEKKKKLTKEAAKFFCDVCATSFTRRSSLKKHHLSQSHLIQIQQAISGKDQEKEAEENFEKTEKMNLIQNENNPDSLDVLNELLDQHFKENDSIPREKNPAPITEKQPENMEDDLLDEEICKITENMTHDEYVLTDHISPVFPEAASTPIKNLEVKAAGKKAKKDKNKRKKKNLADEHLDLDTPAPSLDTNSQNSIEEDDKNVDLENSVDVSKEIQSQNNKQVEETPQIIPDIVKGKRKTRKENVKNQEKAEISRPRRNQNKQNYKEYDHFDFDQEDPEIEVFSKRNKGEISTGKEETFGKQEETLTNKEEISISKEEISKPRKGRDSSKSKKEKVVKDQKNDSACLVEPLNLEIETKIADESSLSLKEDVKQTSTIENSKTFDEDVVKLDFLNVSEALRAQTDKTNCNNSINTEFDSDDNSLNTDMSVDIQKLLDDPELSIDNNSTQADSQTAFTNDSILSKVISNDFIENETCNSIDDNSLAKGDEIEATTTENNEDEFEKNITIRKEIEEEIEEEVEEEIEGTRIDENKTEEEETGEIEEDENGEIEEEETREIEEEETGEIEEKRIEEIEPEEIGEIEPREIEETEPKEIEESEPNETGVIEPNEIEEKEETRSEIETVKSVAKSEKGKQRSRSKQKKGSARSKKVNRGEFSDNEDVLETQNKNKIVRSVFGRVFGGEKVEKVDKVKEVLEDWNSKSESSDNDLNKLREVDSSKRSRGDSKHKKESKKNLKRRSRTSSGSSGGKTLQKRKNEIDSQNNKTEIEPQKKKAEIDSQKKKTEIDSQKKKTETDLQKKKTEITLQTEDSFFEKLNTSRNCWQAQQEGKLKTSRVESCLGSSELLITSSRCRQSKKRAEERISTISRAFDESPIPDDDLILTKGSRNEIKITSESVSLESTEDFQKKTKKTVDKNWKENLLDNKCDDSSKNDNFEQGLEFKSSQVVDRQSPSTVSQISQNSEEDEMENDLLRRRMSPYFDYNNSYTSLGSSTNSDNETNDEFKNKKSDDQNQLRRKSCSSEFSGEKIVIRSPLSSHENMPEVVTIAPTDAIEDNALDVPQEIISATAAVSSMSQNKSRQGKVLNFDEELFVECCSRLKATTEKELRGAKKIKLDHYDAYRKEAPVQIFGSAKDRWRDVESQNSLGSLLESVNQLLGEEMYSNNDKDNHVLDNQSERSSRSASPDASRPDNLGYEDSLDVAFEHNNKLRDKIQQRMRESENLISNAFGQKSNNSGDFQLNQFTERNDRQEREHYYGRMQNRFSVPSFNTSNGIYSSGLDKDSQSIHGGLLDKALSNLLHNNDKHDHNGSTPMTVLAELACARAPTSTDSMKLSTEVKTTVASTTNFKDFTIKKNKNPIKELFERKKELYERKQIEKAKSDVIFKTTSQKGRRTKKSKKRQEFPLIRNDQYDGLAEKKKRRDIFEKKDDLNSSKTKDIYDFDEEDSQIESSVLPYRIKPEINFKGKIFDCLENGNSSSGLSKRFESIISHKFKDIEKFAPKTKGALKAYQSEDKLVTGPMDDFVERKKGSKRPAEPANKHKLKKKGKNAKRKSRNAWYENDSSDEFITAAKTDDVGVGISKSQRTCSKGKQNLFAELSTSSESESVYEEFEEEVPVIDNDPSVTKEKDSEDRNSIYEDRNSINDGNSINDRNSISEDINSISEDRNSISVDRNSINDRNSIISSKDKNSLNTTVEKNKKFFEDVENETYDWDGTKDDLESRASESDSESESELIIDLKKDSEENKDDEISDEASEEETKKDNKQSKKEWIPLEEALNLLEKNDNLDGITKEMKIFAKGSRAKSKRTESESSNKESKENHSPLEEPEVPDDDLPVLPEKLTTNEKPQKEPENLPLHVFLSRKVQESKKRKQLQRRNKKLQQASTANFEPIRRQRKCAIGKQGLLAEISSSDDEVYSRVSHKRTKDRFESEKSRKQKKESKEKRKERYIEKKHEQMIAKEQKAIEEEILRELGKNKEELKNCDESGEINNEDSNEKNPGKMDKNSDDVNDSLDSEGESKKKHDDSCDSESKKMQKPKNKKNVKRNKSESSKSRRNSKERKLSNSKEAKERKLSNSKDSKERKLANSKDSKERKLSNSKESKERRLSISKDSKERRLSSSKRDSGDEELRTTKFWNRVDDVGVAIGRRKRAAANQLYYWSSSSDEEEMIETTTVAEEEDDRLEQHGWIVGDSHKKMITMLAMEKQLKEKRRRSEDEFESGKGKSKKHRNSTS